MSIFNQIKQALNQQLAQVETTDQLIRLTAVINHVPNDADILSWLKAQSYFPQMYWRQRNQLEQFVAVGQVEAFERLDIAAQFGQQQQVRLVGGIQFEGKVHFILPRLLLWQQQDHLTAELFFYIDEYHQVELFLANIAEPSELKQISHQALYQTKLCQFEQWQTNILQAIKEIQQATFDKVVLANATQMMFEQPLSSYDLLAQSRIDNCGCYHFLWAENADEQFIGSSPERLYQRQQRQFFTEALAGTVAVGDNDIETAQNACWLLNDHKNRYENWLVVDDICNNLADCASDIKVGEAHIKQLRNVQHLRRFIQTELAPYINDADCLSRIHPTAAVAGLPRSQAKQFIQQHEPFQRGWYAGTLGYFSPEYAEFCVTLRSAKCDKNKMTVYAGAGIVAESDPISEWREIERKARAIGELVFHEKE